MSKKKKNPFYIEFQYLRKWNIIRNIDEARALALALAQTMKETTIKE
jgi:hypothetical protein